MILAKAVRRAVLPAVIALSFAAGAVPTLTAQGAPVEVIATDFAFSAPDSLPAGPLAMVMTNAGEEPHHAQIVRLNDDVSYDQLFNAFRGSPDAAFALLTFWGGPGVAEPGQSSSVIVSMEAGNYALLCFISSPDGLPHLAKGMVKPFVVVDSGPRAAAPVSSATTTLRDFRFDLPNLTAGASTLGVRNEGRQPHEIAVIQLAGGASLADVFASESGEAAGPPPFTFIAGFQALSTGRNGWLQLDLKPGRYVALCFVPDSETGLSHAELGMVAGFIVE